MIREILLAALCLAIVIGAGCLIGLVLIWLL